MTDIFYGVTSLVQCSAFLYFVAAAAFLGISLLIRKIWHF